MSKHAISRKQNQETSVGGQRMLHWASVIKRDPQAFIIEEGMKVLPEVLRQQQEALADQRTVEALQAVRSAGVERQDVWSCRDAGWSSTSLAYGSRGEAACGGRVR